MQYTDMQFPMSQWEAKVQTDYLTLPPKVSWSQHLFPFSDKTPHKNKVEAKLKKERSFGFISFPFFLLLFRSVRYSALFQNSTDLRMKLERNLFFRGHRKIVIFFSMGVGLGGCRSVTGGRIRGGRRWKWVEVYKDGGFARCSQTDRQTGTDRQAGGGWDWWWRAHVLKEKMKMRWTGRGRESVLCHVWMKTSSSQTHSEL